MEGAIVLVRSRTNKVSDKVCGLANKVGLAKGVE